MSHPLHRCNWENQTCCHTLGDRPPLFLVRRVHALIREAADGVHNPITIEEVWSLSYKESIACHGF